MKLELVHDSARTSRPPRKVHQDPVPFLDLKLSHTEIADELTERIAEIMDSAAFVLGPQVTQFESEYAEFCGVADCVGVGNGTDAIELALRAAGIGPGDEVIIPANTFVATAEAVVHVGATLVLADCDDHFLLDPEQVAARATSRTRAVIGVDLYGQIADFQALREAVDEDVLLFEDAAQSQGAERFGQSGGSFGTAAATSFYPGKNLGAYGDAGAVTTDQPDLATRIRAMRNHGGVARYQHDYLGRNSRLDSIQAAVLSLKLRLLPGWNEQRRAAAERYQELLAGHPAAILPAAALGNTHVWHLFVIKVPERDRVLTELAAAGIGAGVHYPAPIHRVKAFAGYFPEPESYPVAESSADAILSLPMFPGITESQQERVVGALIEALR